MFSGFLLWKPIFLVPRYWLVALKGMGRIWSEIYMGLLQWEYELGADLAAGSENLDMQVDLDNKKNMEKVIWNM